MFVDTRIYLTIKYIFWETWFIVLLIYLVGGSYSENYSLLATWSEIFLFSKVKLAKNKAK